MELHAGERAVLDDGGEPFAVRGRRGRLGDVGVREPECVVTGLHMRPADARNTLRLDADGATRHEPEPVDAAVLLGVVERKLQPEADPECRFHTLAQYLVEAALAQPLHGRARAADAGE